MIAVSGVCCADDLWGNGCGIVVVDNGSIDGTAGIACRADALGALATHGIENLGPQAKQIIEALGTLIFLIVGGPIA